MSSPAGSWRITKIANSARRFLASLELELQERLVSGLESLELHPFSGDVLRLGSFRIYYRADPSQRSIEVVLIDKRGQIKERSIQKL